MLLPDRFFSGLLIIETAVEGDMQKRVDGQIPGGGWGSAFIGNVVFLSGFNSPNILVASC